ncbi:MAG: hypothetical protein CM15mV5_2830 [uncultured marine virus]|nr:MAG: hypothetical protein CM15mV5_2830 [uncultured marine virus]
MTQALLEAAEGYVLVYDSASQKFQTTNVLNHVTVNGGSSDGINHPSKRSTGTSVPSSLEFGELALTVGTGTQVNRGDRIFIGDNNTTVQVIGGKYFTDMLDHVHGVLTANSGVIVDNNSKIDRFRVDDINIDGNVVETDTTDQDMIFRANGTGKIVIEDSQEFEFGTTGDIEFKFDEVANVLRLDRVGAMCLSSTSR